LPAALQRLWEKFLPEISRRIRILDQAVSAMETGALTAELRVEAHEAAHKLAGTLGTFGHPQGSLDARALEEEFASSASTVAAAELRSRVAALQQIVRTR
jgi:HPt (histidine-containing phosphotransfer) domain-containing protein